jgi:hypothetical protein
MKLRRTLLTAALATLLTLGLAPPSAWAATWVPWDGFHITSLANCNARKAYIAKTYAISLRALRCKLYVCSPNYYLLEIDIDQALLSATGKTARIRSERLVRTSAAGAPSPMCGAA